MTKPSRVSGNTITSYTDHVVGSNMFWKVIRGPISWMMLRTTPEEIVLFLISVALVLSTICTVVARSQRNIYKNGKEEEDAM